MNKLLQLLCEVGAIITFAEGRRLIVSNAVFVNDDPFTTTSNRELRNGDIVSIGKYKKYYLLGKKLIPCKE